MGAQSPASLSPPWTKTSGGPSPTSMISVDPIDHFSSRVRALGEYRDSKRFRASRNPRSPVLSVHALSGVASFLASTFNACQPDSGVESTFLNYALSSPSQNGQI